MSGQIAANPKLKKQPLSRTKSLVPTSTSSGDIAEKNNPVERTKSEGSSLKPDADREKMLPKMGNPCYASTAGYGGSWSSGMPQIAIPPEGSQLPPTSMSGGWATIPTALPHNIAGSCAEMFLEPDGGGHLFVAKRLSDPDNKAMKSFPKQSSPQTHSHQVPEMANLHRKLQRQLTLNPAYDPRLVHLGGYMDRAHPIISPPQEPYSLLKSQQEPSVPRSNSQENLLPSGFSHIPHQPLGRMGSDSRVPGSFPMSSQVWDTMAEHQTVTRIASAPDSCNQWPPSARMQHLNSTSDTRLNLYPDLSIQPPHQRLFPTDMQQHRQWLSQSHGLDPPRPMSPAGIQMWQEPIGRARGSSQVLHQPVRPSSVPPPSIQGLIQQHQGGRPASPELGDSARYRLYFHLASIFPKEQVKTVMDLYPQETNPQKICAAILTMFPKG